MIDAQSWPPLCGAVAGCGALLVVSGAAKLVRTARAADSGTAIQRALRLSDVPWRIFQALAGAAELAVGLLVCVGVRPAVTDALMACQGVVFVALLTYVIRARVPGDCGCVTRRRPTSPEKRLVTWWSVGRAAVIASAGLAGALVGARPPAALTGLDAALAWAVAVAVLVLLAGVDLDARTPRCRRALLFPARRALAEVTQHKVYLAMLASLGTIEDRALFRRAGCVDEFWFPTRTPYEDGRRYLEIKAGRAASGALALSAAVVEHAPAGSLRTLTTRPASGARGERNATQPSGRHTRLQERQRGAAAERG